VIQSFADNATEDIFNGIKSKRAKKRLDPILYPIAQRKLDMLNSAYDLIDLKVPPANRLEALKGDLKGRHSIRINDQYRIVFSWGKQGP
jgi:proteic killer suppression protein